MNREDFSDKLHEISDGDSEFSRSESIFEVLKEYDRLTAEIDRLKSSLSKLAEKESVFIDEYSADVCIWCDGTIKSYAEIVEEGHKPGCAWKSAKEMLE